MAHLFITGASGAIGSALIPRLLAMPGQRVTMLLRSASDAAMAERVDRMARYWGLSSEALRDRVTAVRGDIRQPHLGLQPAQLAEIAESTTHVVHSAADVRLNMTPAEAHASAVVPTQTLLDFARRAASNGMLCKVEVVSTVGVWGRTPGNLPEAPVPPDAGFHNTYEAAKWEAEALILREGQGLPITLHRPSMVVGDSATGRASRFQVFYHLCEFLSGVRTFGIMPRFGPKRLDTVPVDWIAAVICESLARPEFTGRIFNLCSGPGDALPLSELQRIVRATWASRGIRLPTLRVVNPRLLLGLIPGIKAVSGPRMRRALSALPPVLEYLAEEQGFSNEQTLATLQPLGLALPRPLSYLPAVLGYYLDHHAKGPAL